MIGSNSGNVAKGAGLVLGIMAIISMMIVPLLTAGLDGARDEEEKYECDAAADMDASIKFDWKDSSGSLELTSPGYGYALTSSTSEAGTNVITGGGTTDPFVCTLTKGAGTEATGSSSYRIVGVTTGLNPVEVETIGVANLKVQVKSNAAADNVKLVCWFVDGDNGNWIVQASESKEVDITTVNKNVTLDFSMMAVSYAKTVDDPTTVYLFLFMIQENTETNYLGTTDALSLDLRFYGDYSVSNNLGFSRIEQFEAAMFVTGLVMIIGAGFMTPLLNMPEGWGRALAGQFDKQRSNYQNKRKAYDSQYRRR